MKHSTEFSRLQLIYEGIDSSTTAIEACKTILQSSNTSAGVCAKITNEIFSLNGRNRTQGSYLPLEVPDSVKMIDHKERQSRDIVVSALNDYIKFIEGYRWGDKRIYALYAVLIYRGLYGVLNDLYVPEALRSTFDSVIDALNNTLNDLVTETQKRFESYNNEKLNSVVKSLGRMILSQRSDQIETILSDYQILTPEDKLYIQEQRNKFLVFNDNPQLNVIQVMFGLKSNSYYTQLNKVIQELTERMDESQIELLTEILMK